MERRGTRGQYSVQISRPALRGNQGETSCASNEKWIKYALLAQKKEVKFENLFNLLTKDLLKSGYHALSGRKAKGIDDMSKEDFGETLEARITALHLSLKSGTYRPMPKRETFIPKANGKLRPIAIASFTDKVVEHSLSKIIQLAFEPIFIRNSFGFRPNKSAHKAIDASYMILKDDKRPWVVEIDFENFFNSVPHKELMKMLKKRITDKRIVSLVNRLLKSEIISTEKRYWQTVGTPQGSVVSPVLANIYLHYVLDEWFAKEVANFDSQMVRYADDAVFMFKSEQDARDLLTKLGERLEVFKLKLNMDKTKIIDFRKASKNCFNFLGFTFYWGKATGKKTSSLKVKTEESKFFKKIEEFKEWIKLTRSKLKAGPLMKKVKLKLRGHYNYYGYQCNRSKLSYFHYQIVGICFKWLNRRSQKKSYTWEQFNTAFRDCLLLPPGMPQLKPLGVRHVR
jgi:RNA-directed DNA polymerase